MKGNNEFHLCAATMIEALQEWADKHLVDRVTVLGVAQSNSGYDTTFVVKVTPTETTS